MTYNYESLAAVNSVAEMEIMKFCLSIRRNYERSQSITSASVLYWNFARDGASSFVEAQQIILLKQADVPPKTTLQRRRLSVDGTIFRMLFGAFSIDNSHGSALGRQTTLINILRRRQVAFSSFIYVVSEQYIHT
jgi:hypothetical protein